MTWSIKAIMCVPKKLDGLIVTKKIKTRQKKICNGKSFNCEKEIRMQPRENVANMPEQFAHNLAINLTTHLNENRKTIITCREKGANYSIEKNYSKKFDIHFGIWYTNWIESGQPIHFACKHIPV